MLQEILGNNLKISETFGMYLVPEYIGRLGFNSGPDEGGQTPIMRILWEALTA